MLLVLARSSTEIMNKWSQKGFSHFEGMNYNLSSSIPGSPFPTSHFHQAELVQLLFPTCWELLPTGQASSGFDQHWNQYCYYLEVQVGALVCREHILCLLLFSACHPPPSPPLPLPLPLPLPGPLRISVG